MFAEIIQKLTKKSVYEANKLYLNLRFKVLAIIVILFVISAYFYGQYTTWKEYTIVRNSCMCGKVKLVETSLYATKASQIKAICE